MPYFMCLVCSVVVSRIHHNILFFMGESSRLSSCTILVCFQCQPSSVRFCISSLYTIPHIGSCVLFIRGFPLGFNVCSSCLRTQIQLDTISFIVTVDD